MTTFRRCSAAILLLIAVLGACALPTDDSAQVLSGEEVENAMRPTTTSTTQAAGSTQQRNLYFYDLDDVLTESPVQMPLDTDIAEVLSALSQAPEDTDFRSAVPEPFVVTTTELDDGVLTVVLADDTLLQLGGSELARAVAQIVLTATQLPTEDVDAVRFVLDGEPREVPAGPELTNTDEPVRVCDYRQFLPDEDCSPFT